MLEVSARGEELAWRTSSFFFLVQSGRRSVGDGASSSSSSAVLADCVWAKVRAEPHYGSIMFWGGDPLPIPGLLELLGRTCACPFPRSIVDRFGLDLARSRLHLVEGNIKHV